LSLIQYHKAACISDFATVEAEESNSSRSLRIKGVQRKRRFD
jgi:hypothetical protein